MTREVPERNPPLSAEEELAVAKLLPKDLDLIDTTLLSCAGAHWQKLAMLAARAEAMLELKYPEVSHTFYVMRVKALNELGRLEAQGDLDYMRFSEVRLPQRS